ncbi:DUF2130 domain-containing protein [Candidatus Saccharibacteria bacterium]|nr:DUF2130 domain-containing protein [Candidatus Saccharibacteria bacterium]
MHHEIKCPNCGKTFTIDEASYAEIQAQVRNTEFNRELESRLHLAAESNAKEIELTKKSTAESFRNSLAEKDLEIANLKSQLTNSSELLKSKYESTISELKSELENTSSLLSAKYEGEITNLKSQLENADSAKKLAVTEAVGELTRERDRLQSDLNNAAALSSSRELMLKQNYEQQIRDRDDAIERLKDMKSKLSTKMVGETLEQHCQNEFNSIRATAFPRAEFGKDNTVSASGSKGDFIFRDFDEAGNEIVSIMFEMKNENDTTATKHKNEHFFKELDKDRTEKKCEYAVLVTMLEAENEFYNRGIVDVSYEYPKMYVIRPQFFLPLIGILVSTAKNSLAYKAELARIKNQNIDITNFEDKLNAFKTSFALNSDRATANFKKAIDDIDKSIKYLEDTKDALLKTIKNFDTANNKLDDLTVKRLTRGNETMTRLFANLDQENS